MKKRILSIVLAVSLCLTLLPATALAADYSKPDIKETTIGSTKLETGTYYLIGDDGTSSTESASETNYNIYYSTDDETGAHSLTLNNANLNSPIYVLGGTTINLVGENVLGQDKTVSVGIQTISAATGDTALTVKGDGSLTILCGNEGIVDGVDSDKDILIEGGTINITNKQSSPIYSRNGSITISGNAKVTANSGNSSISCAEDLTITGNAEVNITAPATALSSSNKMIISGSAQVTATSTNGCPIQGSYGLEILGDASVTATGKTGALSSFSGSILIEGTATAELTGRPVSVPGGVSGNAAVSVGTDAAPTAARSITVKGKLTVKSTFAGIWTWGTGDITIDGGEVSVNAPYGIMTRMSAPTEATGGNVTVQNKGTLTINGDMGTYPQANNCTLTVDNSTVDITTSAWGLYWPGPIVLKDSTVTCATNYAAIGTAKSIEYQYSNGYRFWAGASADSASPISLDSQSDHLQDYYVKIEPGSEPSAPTYNQLSDNSFDGAGIEVKIKCTTQETSHTESEIPLLENKDGTVSYQLGDVTWDTEEQQWYCDVTVYAAPYIASYSNSNGAHVLASGESNSRTVRFWYTEGQTNPWKTPDGYNGTQRLLEFNVVDAVISRTITVSGTADSPTQVTLNTATITPSGTDGAVTYAVSTTNDVPTDPDSWQTSTVFTGLTANTTYYFFAKVAANGNYAEAVSAGTAITTPAKSVSGIEVITQPNKLTYNTGEALDLTGLTVKVKYNDGTEETIFDLTKLSTNPTNDAVLTVTGNNGKPVTITSGGQTCTSNDLTVNKGTQTPLTITGVPKKIYSGDSFALTAEGGSGTGTITWSVVSGPARIDQNGTVTVTGVGEITVKVVKAGEMEYEQTECSVTFAVVQKPSPGSSSSGGSSSSSAYPVNVDSAQNGTVTVSPRNASRGTIVTITVTPDDGCALDGLTVTDKNGREISVKDKGDGKYSFIMPASKVTVSAKFAEISTSYANCPGDETCPIRPFIDANTTAWYHDGVHYCIENGLMSGYGNGLFGPNDNLSRAQLAQILYSKEGKPNVSGSSSFTDVADGAWYADAVTWAAANGIVAGYSNGLFGPNDPITREQLAVMLWRYAKLKGYDTTQGGMIIREFSDYESISGYAMDAMTWAVNTGVIGGDEDKSLRPQNNATRAQVAQMLKNFLENIG